MVTAVLVLTLSAAASTPPVRVEGDSRCPTSSEVAAILPELLPAAEVPYPDIAWIEAAGVDLRIELRSPTGEVLFSRQIASSGTCAELATVAAVVVASWTAERNPAISLLQPTMAAPAKPATPPHAPAPPATPERQGNVPPPSLKKAWELDLAVGVGSSVNDAGAVGAGRLEVGVRGRRLGLRAGLAAETERNESIATRTVSWRRYGLSLGPTFAVVKQPVVVAARADIFAGLTTVAGHGFDVDLRSSALAPGLALALRLEAPRGRIRPWIEIGGQYWLASQAITITREQQPTLGAPLPSPEARLFAGVSVQPSP
jgi:hypothetical protein